MIKAFLILFALFSSVLAWSEELLPRDVHVKTHDQSFSTEYYYALKDGKLWVKPNRLLSGQDGPWTLFQGTGVPFGKKAKSFGPDDQIVEFSTEGLIVVARSNTGRLYLWDPTKKGKPEEWHDEQGSPFEESLMLPKSRDWAFSLSVTVAPWKRRTPMKDINSYYEDTAGNKIVFGFTATVYTLDPDGQRIRYWDTGLPSSFHRAFATPERGRFMAERLAAAGSTLFVIDKSGKMYTRMFDYEMFGACPGLRFSFEKIKHDPVEGPDDVPLYAAERVLPLEDWVEQKFDLALLGGKAELTTSITIRITGEGNAARELRVQGRNREGQYGYYVKPITGTQWSFVPTGVRYEERSVVLDPTRPRALGYFQDKTYVGSLRQSGERKLEVQLADFNYFDTPSELRVKLASGRVIRLTLHTFDAWGPMTQQKENPALVGSILGEPKLLIGTLEIPRELLNSEDPEVKNAIELYFRRFHLIHGAFSIQADDGHVELRTRKIQRNSAAFMDYRMRKPLHVAVSRTVTEEELAHRGIISLTRMANLDSLLYKGDPAELDALIRENEALLKEIKSFNRQQKWAHFKQGILSGLGVVVFTPVNWFMSLTGIAGRDPLWTNLSMGGGGLLKDHATMNLKAAFTNRAGYADAVRLLKERIQSLKTLSCARHLLKNK